MTTRQSPFRIAHIGAGEWSRYAHGPVLKRLMQQSVVSLELICDIQIDRARAFRDQFGYRLATDHIHDSLAAVRPDAIVCTIHPAGTAELVHSLLPLGIPLLIEKPPGTSLAEAKSLATDSMATGTFTFVAFNRRTIPSILRLKEWTTQHPVRFARAEMLRTHRMEPDFAITTGIHALDTMRFLLGHPKSIEVNPLPHDTPNILTTNIRDYAIKLAFDHSLMAEVALMLNTGLRRESYFLSAQGASAEAALSSAYSSELSYQGDRQWEDQKIVQQHTLANDPLIDGGLLGEYETFFRLLREGKPSTCSLRDAAHSMQLAEAVQNGYSGLLPPLFEE